jgi:hypothetical protein
MSFLNGSLIRRMSPRVHRKLFGWTGARNLNLPLNPVKVRAYSCGALHLGGALLAAPGGVETPLGAASDSAPNQTSDVFSAGS